MNHELIARCCEAVFVVSEPSVRRISHESARVAP
jgi:hypothetical protein